MAKEASHHIPYLATNLHMAEQELRDLTPL